ncbi:MAG: PepSY-associated TM helix domain-containing protein [Chryseosolibacter sp.]
MKTFNFWNRKLHIHIGLFLLLFIWLFSLSGLLLNHHWEFATFWEQREQKESVTDMAFPANLDSAAMLHTVMEKLRISGEVSNVQYSGDAVDFRVTSPGKGRELHVDLAKGTVTQREYTLNIWGKIRTLHTFNGVDKRDVGKEANWLVTSVWKFALDGVALLFVFLCVSSWVMWYKIRRDYRWGAAVLAVGFLVSFYFVYLIAVL